MGGIGESFGLSGRGKGWGVAGCALAAALMPTPVHGQATAASASDSEVAIIAPGQLAKLQDLEFGSIAVGGGGGTLTVKTDGTLAASGSVSQLGYGYPAAFTMQRAQFAGNPALIAPGISSTIRLTHVTDRAATMRVTDFTTDFNRTVRVGKRDMPAYLYTGHYIFRVGATLHVAADQKPGRYEGEFLVVIDYQ